MRPTRRLRALSAVFALAVSALAPFAAADAPSAQGTIVVTLEDGSTIPLHNWLLSYEYAVAKQGPWPLFGPTSRRESAELLLGKKAKPTAGQAPTITYLES